MLLREGSEPPLESGRQGSVPPINTHILASGVHSKKASSGVRELKGRTGVKQKKQPLQQVHHQPRGSHDWPNGKPRGREQPEFANMSLKEYMLKQKPEGSSPPHVSSPLPEPVPGQREGSAAHPLTPTRQGQRNSRYESGSRGEEAGEGAEEEDLLAIEERTIENEELTARSGQRKSPFSEEEKRGGVVEAADEHVEGNIDASMGKIAS